MIREGSEIVVPTQDYPRRKFRLIMKLGEGGYGCVYSAVSQFWGNNSNKEFALKFSPQQTVKEQEYNFIKQLMEYQSSNNEQSFPSNMIRVLDIFQHYFYFVTVMEKGGQDLHAYLGQNRQIINNLQKTKICLDVVMPIYYLHANGLVHRYIKPDNYIKVGDKFKLFDFGLVRKTYRMADFDMTHDVRTMIYLAPEMIENISITDKVDIWSLGCLFYEIFNPESLFDGHSFTQISQQILNHKYNSKFIYDKIDQLSCDLPIKKLMKQMLQFDQNKRFNIKQVLEQLQNILHTQFIYIAPQVPQQQISEEEIQQLEQENSVQPQRLENI